MAVNKFRNSASLSDRELQIIKLVSTGLTNEKISKQLEISKRTVDNHLSNILEKTKTHNRVELLNWALYWGKICLEDFNCCLLSSKDRHPQQKFT